jgi:hypothetical protein
MEACRPISPLALSFSSDASTSMSSNNTANEDASAASAEQQSPKYNNSSNKAFNVRMEKLNDEYALDNALDALDNIDAMYNSLRQLSSASAITKQVRLRKLSQSSIPFTNVQKELTFTLNPVYFTNGKASPSQLDVCEVQEIIGARRDLHSNKIKSIGTSLKNCVQSDMISIDIDPESTRLPLMCKLMIIVEGAAYERGTRVLVCDASTQCDTLGVDEDRTKADNQNMSDESANESLSANAATDANNNNNNPDSFKNIPIHIEKNSKFNRVNHFISRKKKFPSSFRPLTIFWMYHRRMHDIAQAIA